MTIDIHGHFVDPHYLDELQRVMRLEVEKTSDGKTLMRHNGYTLAWTRPDMFDMDHRLRDMDAKGIATRVLSVSTPGVYPWRGDAQVAMTRHVNDMLAKDCRAHPDRFIGFASLPLHDIDASLAEIDRATAELGMKGVAIGSNIDGPPLNDARLAAMGKDQRDAAAGVRASDVSTRHLGDGRVRIAAAGRADLRHHAGGGAADLRRGVRALSELPLHPGAYGRCHDPAVRAARQRVSPVSRLPQIHQQA